MTANRLIRWIAIVLLRSALPVAAQPATAPARAELPAADPTVQRWVGVLSQRQTSLSYPDFSAALIELSDARNRSQLADEAWLDQVLLFLMAIDDARARESASRLLTRATQRYVRVESVPWLSYLGARLESNNPEVVRVANEMLHSSFAMNPTGIFSTIGSYLRGLEGVEPSWKLVRMMYEVDPGQAMKTTAEVHFGETRPPQRQADRAIRLGLERDRKEVEYLLLSWELADEQQRAGWSQRVLAKLTALAGHSHWCVRAYAAAVVRRELLKSADRSNNWLADPVLLKQLSEDTNPFVSAMAREIAAR